MSSDISIPSSGAYASIQEMSRAVGDSKAAQLEAFKDKDLSNASDEELMEACKSFESYFVEMVMKEVTKTVDLTGGASDNGNSTLLEFYKDKTISQLAGEVTEKADLGLAQKMYEQMKHQS